MFIFILKYPIDYSNVDDIEYPNIKLIAHALKKMEAEELQKLIDIAKIMFKKVFDE